MKHIGYYLTANEKARIKTTTTKLLYITQSGGRINLSPLRVESGAVVGGNFDERSSAVCLMKWDLTRSFDYG